MGLVEYRDYRVRSTEHPDPGGWDWGRTTRLVLYSMYVCMYYM